MHPATEYAKIVRLFNSISPEEKLLRDCLKQKPAAQEQLYRQHSPRMLGICLRYIADRSTAEEVMVKGFEKVFGNLHTYSGSGALEGWIRRIMVNEALMYLRANKKLQNQQEADISIAAPADAAADAELNQQQLLELVQQLPAGYRSVFNLYAIEGYSHREIAELLGISEGTSKSQLSKARQWLQQAIEKSEAIAKPVLP
jgi:RNA polymerase sigma-70 factor (ECF subfamily)